jgi:C4-dicarboxylate-specific signal transduction histidine kinase
MAVKQTKDPVKRSIRPAHWNGGPGVARAPAQADSLSLLDALPHPCAAFHDRSGSMLHANAPFVTAFGNGTPARSEFETRFEKLASSEVSSADGQALSNEVFHSASGRWYSFTWTRLQLPWNGRARASCSLLNAHDLTERVESLRQQRAQAEQLLFTSRVMSVGEMTTTLAHEINQPLAAIVNYLTAASRMLDQQNGSIPPRLREALALAKSQAEHAAAVVTRIREFVRTREPRREPLLLDELLAHTLQLLQLDAQKRRVRIRQQLAPDLPPVLVDRLMIGQVLTNLIKNAIESMRLTPPCDRQVTISAHLNLDQRVEVRVIDCGCGLAPGEENQLFTPFFTTKPNGMGIGLAICRSIVEYHEGSLYYERNLDRGLSFAFTLTPADRG